MCRINECEPLARHFERRIVARWAHRCSECRRTICRGETFHLTVGAQDQWDERDLKWFVHLLCAHCARAKDWLVEVCDGWVFGQVLEELDEHWDEGYNDPWLRSYTYGMTNQWVGPTGMPLPLPVPSPSSDVINRYMVCTCCDVRHPFAQECPEEEA